MTTPYVAPFIVLGMRLQDTRVPGVMVVVGAPEPTDRMGRVLLREESAPADSRPYSKALWLLRDQIAAGKVEVLP